MRGFRVVCAVGLGSAADACGVTNKGGFRSIKPSVVLQSSRIAGLYRVGNNEYDEYRTEVFEELKTVNGKR